MTEPTSPTVDANENFPIVAIGASAGGLEACKKLLDELPAPSGMAFILVLHLDPNHESMMVELLGHHTKMRVMQAGDGMKIQPDHLYIIPPGVFLGVTGGALQIFHPQARHGTRLPFDFLLHALADDCGKRLVCVVLSGTGTDGSLGLKSVKRKSGYVFAQSLEEANFDGMPRSAIKTGEVDCVLPVAGIAQALAKYQIAPDGAPTPPVDGKLDVLSAIIDLLRSETAHDFTLYKQGTLLRRIERRMALAAIEHASMDRYLALLQSDRGEREQLTKDLLINVTAFFRDGNVFARLADSIIPDLVRRHDDDRPLRVWIAGCSTGEEAYSLAILFREEITAEQRNIKLQVFASDLDPDAIAKAREGLYPESIAADVSPIRLARFFSKEEHAYKVSAELRASVVFTVQDILTDPPFSRLDFASCRNLLIYLGADAQAKVIALLHFSLRRGGILLLGNAETVGPLEGRFEVVSKPERLYRTIGLSRLADITISKSGVDLGRSPPRPGHGQAPSRQAALAELCRRLVVDTYAPAAVLINSHHECLYSLGPTHRYLRVAPGHPTLDLLAMAPDRLRARLRAAIELAGRSATQISIGGGSVDRDGVSVSFDIKAQAILADGENLMLICFVDGAPQHAAGSEAGLSVDVARVAELERELEATRTELHGAIHSLELSSEEQKAINEEAWSINEEYQSTNEELLTSKEELQSLNEELTALNAQLQETLDRQRTTANDLQNILYSTNVATVFLDVHLNIRFFTPATRSLFNVIASDVGRPLADLNSLSGDSTLTADAQTVLSTLSPIEREIETRADAWFMRRILPYRTLDDKVEGVVITFTDISERRAIRKAMEKAKQDAEIANIAKSRFMAAASHDLRQPLQTLTLLQALLARLVEGEKAPKLVARLGDTLGAMSGMLNTMLDINQIEAGVVRAEPHTFAINDLLERLRDEFTYLAQAQKLTFKVIPCSLAVTSDPRLLDQAIRNLLSNALKYTKHGKILLGCRRRGHVISVEIWDTGIGIPEKELQAIFEEYHQIDNIARERNRGLGLGLSIVQRLATLLEHPVHVRSRLGKGSVFAIDIPVAASGSAPDAVAVLGPLVALPNSQPLKGSILVIEDDPDVRELVTRLLEEEGHRVAAVKDGTSAVELLNAGKAVPDLVLADFNLPNGMNGLEAASQLADTLHQRLPVIIMTGDISTTTMRDIDRHRFVQLNKPVKPKVLEQAIQRLLTVAMSGAKTTADRSRDGVVGAVNTIYVVDDDSNVSDGFRLVIEEAGHSVETFQSCEAFLQVYRPGSGTCLLVDAYLPGMSGLELLRKLRGGSDHLPAIMVTGNSDVPMAVEAMKAGASDFLEKPVKRGDLLASITRALEQSSDESKAIAWREASASQIAGLTERQKQIMEMVLAGHPSKNIASDLGISQRTVENHRAMIMKKTGAKSLPALARLAIAAAPKSSRA